MGYFSVHPEGYEPRLFTTTGQDVYELLKNGCVVPRPSLPSIGEFDWWYVKIEKWGDMTFNRRFEPAPVVPQEVWDALRAADVDIEALTGANDGLLSDSSRNVTP